MSEEFDRPALEEMILHFELRRRSVAAAELAEWLERNDRDKVPDVEYRYPDCSICDYELDGDSDSLWCNYCHINWSLDGSGGSFNE